MTVELSRRSVALLVAGAIVTGWTGASLMQPPPPAQSGPVARGPRPLGSSSTSIVQQAERLRQHMAQPPQPARGRNPFSYGPRTPIRHAASNRDQGAVETAPPIAVTPPAPALPVFKLSGIASNAEAGVTVLTAIISDNGTMVFAKAGDKLSNGYSVVRVEETSVTLVDATGVTQTIKLP